MRKTSQLSPNIPLSILEVFNTGKLNDCVILFGITIQDTTCASSEIKVIRKNFKITYVKNYPFVFEYYFVSSV